MSLLAKKKLIRAAVQDATIPFEIINAGLAGDGSDGTQADKPWTTAAGTTLLVVCFTIGKDASNTDTVTGVTFNGDAMTLAGEHSASTPRNAEPGQSWWYLKNPDIGSNLDISWTMEGGETSWGASSFYIVQCFNIRGEAASPIGATDFPDTDTGNASSHSDTITSTAADSILLSAGSWQGNDMAPLSPLHSLTELNEASSGTSTTLDGPTAIGWKQLTSAGSYSYGWEASGADGRGISAIEIKKA